MLTTAVEAVHNVTPKSSAVHRFFDRSETASTTTRVKNILNSEVRTVEWEIGKRRWMMSGIERWRDSGHLEKAIESAGGVEAFEASVSKMLDEARGWRLAELRKRREMTQEQVAKRMGISVARVSQIEAGDVSTQDVLARYISALGGTLKLIADFGDEQLKVA
ncbi:transcriptional regulator [Paractinoplanes durhamensis]|uniref:transcriptional regulator n=1 Tax=Paractinoplanes durhamensis TaxID=113563 RepID=UPI001EF3764A|nr:helix-turn-helix transcriptional regulator [Actinoplanes durhamensis]